MRIALISDAWVPQVNGVVRTLQTTIAELRRRGHTVTAITPDAFPTIPCPSYPDIRLAIGSGGAVRRRLAEIDADAVHIATEGPLGWAARRWCISEGIHFSTSFHTRFPDYLAMRTGLSAELFWPIVRRFHAPAASVMSATPALSRELAARGLTQTKRWSRGVDLTLFAPTVAPHPAFAGLPHPIQLYVGRIAIEKNVEAFLTSTVPGAKVLVGDGPALKSLRQRFPNALFVGALHGRPLAAAYAGADVLVFPSLTDTFGLVMIEALASGTPVAAFAAPGASDVIGGSMAVVGALDGNLDRAIIRALAADRRACAAEGARYSWARCTDQFVEALHPARAPWLRRAAA